MSVGRAPLAFKKIEFQQLIVKEKTSPEYGQSFKEFTLN